MPKLTAQQRKENAERVARIAKIKDVYMCATCDTSPDFVTDLLADVMHWCQANKVDFDNQLRIAHDHYACEKAGIE